MWKLNQIYAKNLCSFKELDYQVLQGHTTLVFGNNMDNDSQGSNGSGKSAMLEAVAIGLTGESLRKVKADEIINDSEDNAIIALTLTNDYNNETLYIRREFSRKNPQDIQIVVQKPDEQPEKIMQAGVLDYNKYVLDKIGLSKDEIYSNFILSKHKYSSFLSSSDREKKEIINRFSNGIVVDESIAALQEDMIPIEDSLKQAEVNTAVLSGKIETLSEQIENAKQESISKSKRKAERIAEWKGAIKEKRALIRSLKDKDSSTNDRLDILDDLNSKMQSIENGDGSINECYTQIKELFKTNSLPDIKDYIEVSKRQQEELKETELTYQDKQTEIANHKKKVDEAKKYLDEIVDKYNSFSKEYSVENKEIQCKIDEMSDKIDLLVKESDTLVEKRMNLNNQIAELQKMLAGTITCPKCNHEFVLDSDIDVNDTKSKLDQYTKDTSDVIEEISSCKEMIAKYTSLRKGLRDKKSDLLVNKDEWESTMNHAKSQLNELSSTWYDLTSSLDNIEHKVNSLKISIENCRFDLFDEAFDILDHEIKVSENGLKQVEIDINNANGAIQSYEESIIEIEKSSDTDIIESLVVSKNKYEADYLKVMEDKAEIEEQLSEYKAQESTFVEFKTHLANTKIDALSHITNEFLEAIGSDIRISFSGFTVLKSGKVRDKISISLLRDGIDCGSFDKFSEGEKTRVNLASILAMHKLTNVNCEDGKGLDLLILDEILEATDEQGLANIFDALNQLQITSLVVSHGNIAEGYPYKTVVNKQNGVSYL